MSKALPKSSFEEVVETLKNERDYQSKWDDTKNNLSDFMLYAEKYLGYAKEAYIHPDDNTEPCRKNLRKVAAICVAALEKFGKTDNR